MVHNKKSILVPLLKGSSRLYDPAVKSLIRVGHFVDPFVSSIRHSCDPNAWYVFDHNELQVRACKDIPAGSEITFCYADERYDYESRTAQLKAVWNISCSCSLCAKGPHGPTGDLRCRVIDLITSNPKRPPTLIPDIEMAIADVHSAGFAYGADLMRPLYQTAMRSYLHWKHSANMLKICLIIYFLIEPSTAPPTPLSQRLNTLLHIISLSDPPIKLGLSALPPRVQELLDALRVNFMELLVIGTEKCYGKESTVGLFERESFMTYVKGYAAKNGHNSAFIPLAKNSEERAVFLVGLNELLGWASIPKMTEEQLLKLVS